MTKEATPTPMDLGKDSVTPVNANAQIAWDLAVPFPVNRISWRPGSTNKRAQESKGMKADKCIALAYLDARDVARRLEAVLGPFGWETSSPDPHVCVLTIHLPDGTSVTRTNRAGDTDVEAEKGAYSTAFKRAASDFGVGRYLYELPNVWVGFRSNYDFDKPNMPDWATPEGYAAKRPRP